METGSSSSTAPPTGDGAHQRKSFVRKSVVASEQGQLAQPLREAADDPEDEEAHEDHPGHQRSCLNRCCRCISCYSFIKRCTKNINIERLLGSQAAYQIRSMGYEQMLTVRGPLHAALWFNMIVALVFSSLWSADIINLACMKRDEVNPGGWKQCVINMVGVSIFFASFRDSVRMVAHYDDEKQQVLKKKWKALNSLHLESNKALAGAKQHVQYLKEQVVNMLSDHIKCYVVEVFLQILPELSDTLKALGLHHPMDVQYHKDWQATMWEGIYRLQGQQHELPPFEMEILPDLRLRGKGSDDIGGEFTLEGQIEQGGNVTITKYYKHSSSLDPLECKGTIHIVDEESEDSVLKIQGNWKMGAQKGLFEWFPSTEDSNISAEPAILQFGTRMQSRMKALVKKNPVSTHVTAAAEHVTKHAAKHAAAAAAAVNSVAVAAVGNNFPLPLFQQDRVLTDKEKEYNDVMSLQADLVKEIRQCLVEVGHLAAAYHKLIESQHPEVFERMKKKKEQPPDEERGEEDDDVACKVDVRFFEAAVRIHYPHLATCAGFLSFTTEEEKKLCEQVKNLMKEDELGAEVARCTLKPLEEFLDLADQLGKLQSETVPNESPLSHHGSKPGRWGFCAPPDGPHTWPLISLCTPYIVSTGVKQALCMACCYCCGRVKAPKCIERGIRYDPPKRFRLGFFWLEIRTKLQERLMTGLLSSMAYATVYFLNMMTIFHPDGVCRNLPENVEQAWHLFQLCGSRFIRKFIGFMTMLVYIPCLVVCISKIDSLDAVMETMETINALEDIQKAVRSFSASMESVEDQLVVLRAVESRVKSRTSLIMSFGKHLGGQFGGSFGKDQAVQNTLEAAEELYVSLNAIVELLGSAAEWASMESPERQEKSEKVKAIVAALQQREFRPEMTAPPPKIRKKVFKDKDMTVEMSSMKRHSITEDCYSYNVEEEDESSSKAEIQLGQTFMR